jgi:hypothetical protein
MGTTGIRNSFQPGIGKIVLGWILALPALPFILILFTYKWLVLLLAKIFRPDLIPITHFDSMMAGLWIMGKEDEELKERESFANVGFYATAEGEIEFSKLMLAVEEMVYRHTEDKIYNWKLRAFMECFGGYCFWKMDKAFELSRHVKEYSVGEGRSLNQFWSSWILMPYPKASPLWEIACVTDSSTGRLRTHIGIKCHHVLGDGITMLEIPNQLFNSEFHPNVSKMNTANIRGSFSFPKLVSE